MPRPPFVAAATDEIPGAVYPSPVVLGDTLLLGADSGAMVTIRTGARFELLDRGRVGKMRATPTAAGDWIYLRTYDHLYALRAD